MANRAGRQAALLARGPRAEELHAEPRYARERDADDRAHDGFGPWFAALEVDVADRGKALKLAGITLENRSPDSLIGSVDSGRIHQALVNLVLLVRAAETGG